MKLTQINLLGFQDYPLSTRLSLSGRRIATETNLQGHLAHFVNLRSRFFVCLNNVFCDTGDAGHDFGVAAVEHWCPWVCGLVGESLQMRTDQSNFPRNNRYFE